MATRNPRINFSKTPPDFRRIALEPGYPLLDRTATNAKFIARWLGRFAAIPATHAETVEWEVRNDQGARLDNAHCELATSRELNGVLKREFKALQSKLDAIAPKTRTEKAVHATLMDNFQDSTRLIKRTDTSGCFLKYQDDGGEWRLLWAWGFQRLDEEANEAVLCVSDACRSLFLLRSQTERKCPECGTVLPEKPSAVKRAALILTLLLLIAGIGYGVYWYIQPRAILTGAVLWQGDHQPVANATIALSGAAETTATTDNTGQFRLERLPDGAVEIDISASGFQDMQLEKELVPGQETAIRVELTGNASIAGRVVNQVNDAPLAGARVTITGTDLTAQSDAEGVFRFDTLRSGPMELDAELDGFPAQHTSTTLQPNQESDVKIGLLGTAILTGRVLSAATEKPLADATATVAGTGQEAHTDEEGWFVLKQVRSGQVTVEVAADGFAAKRQELVLPEDKEHSIQVKLSGAAILSGDVVTDPDNKPLANADVHVDGIPFSAKTNEKGHFSLPGLPSGAVQVVVSAAGYTTENIDVLLQSGQERIIRVVLKGGATLVGTVFSAITDAPVPDAEVRIIGVPETAKTDATGAFRLAGLRGGPVRIEVRVPGFAVHEAHMELPVGKETTLEIRLKGDATLTGIVVDAVTQSPVSNVTVQVIDTKLKAMTDAKGAFQIEGLRSGEVRIGVASEAYPASEPISHDVKAGTSSPVKITLTGDAVINGNVMILGTGSDTGENSGGKPVTGATVNLTGTDRTTQTDDAGHFQLDRLPAGKHTLKIEASGFRAKDVACVTSVGQAAEVTLALGGDATLTGNVRDAITNQPVKDAVIGIEGTPMTATTDEKGHFQIDDVFSGPARVTATADGFKPKTVDHTIDSKKPRAVEIDLTGAAEVSGTVLTTDGKPIPNANIRIAGTQHSCVSGADGTFLLGQCRAAPTTFEISAKNFAMQSVDLALKSDPPNSLGDVRLVSSLKLSGQVINGINEDPIANAAVSLEGTGTSTTTDASGQFTLTAVPPGPVQLKLDAEGFYPETLNVASDENAPPAQVVLSPVLKPGEMRIILTWGDTIPDLDLHVYYEEAPGGRKFHVSHRRRKVDDVELDVDNREGGGPETVTIKKAIPGRYDVIVHVYQDPKDAQQNAFKMRQSKAVLRIYQYGEKGPKRFEADTGDDADYPVWNVGGIEVDDTGNITVQPYFNFNYTDELPEE